MDKDKRIMSVIQDNYNLLEDKGYEVVGVFLYGSQNYKLDYEKSDIDCKAIVLPKFSDIVLGRKPVSTTITLPDNSQIDVKDIRLMMENFRKQNVNFVEILFTKYVITNPKYTTLFYPMIARNETIARYDKELTLKSIAGMCMEKFKAMEHPYPTTKDKIEKFGYDSKQLHHVMRLAEFAERYSKGEPYKDCLVSQNPEYLIDVKRGCYSLERARELAKLHCDKVYTIREKYRDYTAKNGVNSDVIELMENVTADIIEKHFITTFGVNS